MIMRTCIDCHEPFPDLRRCRKGSAPVRCEKCKAEHQRLLVRQALAKKRERDREYLAEARAEEAERVKARRKAEGYDYTAMDRKDLRYCIRCQTLLPKEKFSMLPVIEGVSKLSRICNDCKDERAQHPELMTRQEQEEAEDEYSDKYMREVIRECKERDAWREKYRSKLTREQREKRMDERMRKAAELGMDYGNYMAMLYREGKIKE